MSSNAMKSLDAIQDQTAVAARILVIDDDTVVRSYFVRVLSQVGYEVVSAGDGAAGLALLRERAPDLVLTDVHMPLVGGFDLLEQLRSHDATRHIPIIICSGSSESSFKVTGLDLGANDYLTKPIDSEELIARVRAQLRQAAEAAYWREASLLDPLTGLLNRRGCVETLHRAVARATREVSPLSVVYLDLDGFKPLNDRFGHQAGDECLRNLGQALVRVVRGGDAAARMGGDEFVIILPQAGQSIIKGVVMRVRRVIASIGPKNTNVTLHASIGVATLFDDVSPLCADPTASLLKAADRAMYLEKQQNKKAIRRRAIMGVPQTR